LLRFLIVCKHYTVILPKSQPKSAENSQKNALFQCNFRAF
jgi:hypothetical protein